VTRESVEGRRVFLRYALDPGTPGRRDHRRQREYQEERQRGMHRDEEHDRDGEAENPPRHREHRHVHVVENEYLVAEHRDPVEASGTSCAIVAMLAWSLATCDSSAIVTLSERRCTRVLTVLRTTSPHGNAERSAGRSSLRLRRRGRPPSA
jgi:hypothetical protein